MTLSIEKCIKCGRKTDWDSSAGPEALCASCWDGDPAAGAVVSDAHSAKIAEAGIYTGEDFARMMSALMGDVLAGRVSPDVANAACNAGKNLLKIVEMQYKLTHGRTLAVVENATLQITTKPLPEE